MKAVGVAAPGDLAVAAAYEDAADFLLIDAKPPKGAVGRAATACRSTGGSPAISRRGGPGCCQAA